MKNLLVEDEPGVLRGVTRMMECEDSDREVTSAASSEEALRTIEQHDFDVVVTEMKMSGMDGVASHHSFDICARQLDKTCQIVFATPQTLPESAFCLFSFSITSSFSRSLA